MTHTQFIAALASSAAVLPVLAAASAQEAEVAEDTVDEIVVPGSVTKFSVPLSETPQAIAVVTSDQIALRGAVTVEEALRYMPSVQAELSGRQGFDDFLIRGVTQSRFQVRDGLRLDPGFLQQQEAYGLGVQSRHVMGRIVYEALRLFGPASDDMLEGREAA